jgi:anti-sigma factor RsiW
MRHGPARRRLSQVLDGTLPPALEQAVRSHAAQCGRCGRRLAELELCDRLVAGLPLGVLPLAAPVYGERRLERLARWGAPPPEPRRWLGLEGLAVATAAAALAGVVAIGATRWAPVPDVTPAGVTQVAYVMPAGGPY